MKNSIVLASASPRRLELVQQMGLEPAVIKSQIEEVITESNPAKVVEELSYQKAFDVVSRLEEDGIVLGADTVVAIDGEILGKPKDHQDAYDMIKKLQGRIHQVYTGVTLLRRKGDLRDCFTFSEKTDVYVNPMTDEEIQEYSNSEEPMDKAGAYGIQGAFGRYISKIEGDYYNVVGLPIARVYQEYKKLFD